MSEASSLTVLEQEVVNPVDREPPLSPDEIVRAFATAGRILPRGAMRAALETWETTAPVLLDVLDRYASGEDRSEDTSNVVFFALYLMAQARETRACAPLCRIARDGCALEDLLGDGDVESLNSLLIGTYAGDPTPLYALIEDPDAEGYYRAAAFDALTWLTANGHVPRDTFHAYLRDVHETLQPRTARGDWDGWVWMGWVDAIRILGLEDLVPLVEAGFARGFIGETVMDVSDFRNDLAARLADPDPRAALDRSGIRPIEDAIEELARWDSFKPEADTGRSARPVVFGEIGEGNDEFGDAPVWDAPSSPYVNPFRNVGRNDPCPCGSGKKFKKCCLDKSAL